MKYYFHILYTSLPKIISGIKQVVLRQQNETAISIVIALTLIFCFNFISVPIAYPLYFINNSATEGAYGPALGRNQCVIVLGGYGLFIRVCLITGPFASF